MSDSKAARWLDLVAYLLQHRYPVTRDQIFEQVRDYSGDHESARRKFERDKVELRALGIEIETVRLPTVSWRLAVGTSLFSSVRTKYVPAGRSNVC